MKKTLSTLTQEDQDIQNLINMYNSLKKEEKDMMNQINQIARNRKETSLLMTIPNIAEFSSLMILAEIYDIQPFRSPKELVSYAGLC